MWLWWAMPAAYLAVAATVQPSMAMYRFATRGSEYRNEKAKQESTREAFWLSLMWPVALLMMRSSRAIQAALDDEKMRADAREQIAQHNREIAQREADEFERQLNGTDGLPKHVKVRNLNLDFIGAHIAGESRFGTAFSGKLERIGYGSASDSQHTVIMVAGEYKYPDIDTILAVNGGRP